MAMEWGNQYKVGHQMIDTQHKELFSKINELLTAMKKGKGKEEVEKIMLFLKDYVVNHFRDEERLMQQHTYPDFTSHKAEHTRFLNNFMKLYQEFQATDHTKISTRTVLSVKAIVCDWLRIHVTKIDMQLGAFMKNRA